MSGLSWRRRSEGHKLIASCFSHLRMQFTTYSTSDSRMLSRLEVINRKYKVLFFAANDDVATEHHEHANRGRS